MARVNNQKLVKIVEESIEDFLKKFKRNPWFYSESDMQCELYRMLYSKLSREKVKLLQSVKFGKVKSLQSKLGTEERIHTKKNKNNQSRKHDIALYKNLYDKLPYIGIELKYGYWESGSKKILSDIAKLCKSGVKKGYMITLNNARPDLQKKYQKNILALRDISFKKKAGKTKNCCFKEKVNLRMKYKRTPLKVYFLITDWNNKTGLDLRWVFEKGLCRTKRAQKQNIIFQKRS